jgi:hypothetical protein
MRVSPWNRHVFRDGVGRVAAVTRASFALVLGVTLMTPAAVRADLTASYDGTLTLPKQGEDAIVASGLMQAGNSLTGTVAVNAFTEGVTGLYYVTGTLKKTRFKVTGSSDKGVAFGWKGKTTDTSLSGKAKLKGGGLRAKGTLTLTKRVDQTPTEPPVTCNSDFFTGQVMGSVLSVCAACHVPGGAAEHTTFRDDGRSDRDAGERRATST